MRKALIATYLFAPLCFGFMIGSAISENGMLGFWVFLLVVDIVVGIALRYNADGGNAQAKPVSPPPSASSEDETNFFTYGARVSNIVQNEGATEYFTPSEIVCTMVNLVDAKQCLTEEEYFYVCVVFEMYRRQKKKLLLDGEGFVKLFGDIVAHFDLIAPYYKFCGDSSMDTLKGYEEEKSELRRRAKLLLDKKAIFQKEWMDLHEEYLSSY